MLLPLATWVPILDGDPAAAAMYERHYSSARSRQRRRARGTMLFLGPGEKLVLMTPCRRGLFAWRRERFRASGQAGVECAIFRNEGAGLSSELICAAEDVAEQRWPGERRFTHVDPRAVASANPGYCFKVAGWRSCGVTSARKLLILESTAKPSLVLRAA